ncbi:MAG: hypothetical protein E6151_06165, partial [Dialister micraerophilus]|nr:hypothetical protein [Dialister micraerophilus]
MESLIPFCKDSTISSQVGDPVNVLGVLIDVIEFVTLFPAPYTKVPLAFSTVFATPTMLLAIPDEPLCPLERMLFNEPTTLAPKFCEPYDRLFHLPAPVKPPVIMEYAPYILARAP